MSRRIRTIKAEVVLEDERASALSDPAWRLWVSLRTFADDFGGFRAAPKYLAAQVWQDTGRAKRVPGLLAEVADAGLVSLYTAAGQSYGRIVGWDTEQRLDYRSEKTRLPGPETVPVQIIRDVAAILGQPRGGPPESAAGFTRIRKDAVRAGGVDLGVDPDLGDGHGVDPDLATEAPRLPTVEALGLAFAKGVEAGVGYPISPPGPDEATKLLRALSTHASGVSDQAAWVRTEAAAFVVAASGDEMIRRNGFPVWAFVRWLNGRNAKPAPPKIVPRPEVQRPGKRDWFAENTDAKEQAK